MTKRVRFKVMLDSRRHMNTYTIQTGGQTWEIQANNGKDAVVAAFKKHAPKAPGPLTKTGLLTKISSKEEPEFYVDTIRYLQLAGYKVEPNADVSRDDK